MPSLELTPSIPSFNASSAETLQQILLDEFLPAPENMLRLWIAGGRTQTLSYLDLLDKASHFAQEYRELGAVPGDRIVIILKHSEDLYTSIIGAWLAGLIPSIWAFPSAKVRAEDYTEQLKALIKRVEPEVIVTYPELKHDLTQSAVTDHIKLVTATDVPKKSIDLASKSLLASSISPDDIALLQFSSGTTGLKKGVALTHRAVLWQARQYAVAIQLSSQDRIVSWLPLYHDMGLIACLLMPLICRVPLSALCPFEWAANPNSWLDVVTKDRATLSWLPNFAFNFMAQRTSPKNLKHCDLSQLRAVFNCSEPVQANSHQAFLRHLEPYGLREEALATTYALAENTFAATTSSIGKPPVIDLVDSLALTSQQIASPVPPASPLARKLVSSGRPLPDTELNIVDAQRQPLPERHVGEIALYSPCLLTEYFRDQETTRSALHDGWLYTGDLGYLANDELFVIGRQKEMLIIRGINVFPQDIEAIVNHVDGVIPGRTAAVGISNESTGTDELVILAETMLTDQDRKNLAKKISNRVAQCTDLMPADVYVCDHMWLRKSTAGKISRNINRDRYLSEKEQQQDRSSIASVSMSDSEHSDWDAARRCVSDALQGLGVSIEEIESDQPLISSGLIDSLALAGLFSALERETGTLVNPAQTQDLEVFDTLERLAAWIHSHRRSVPAEAIRPATAHRRWDEHVLSPEQIPLKATHPIESRKSVGWWTRYYKWVFWRHGVRFGPGLRVLGRLLLRFDGDARNIRLGSNVTLLPGVDLKVREEGQIILHDGASLDTNARLVAARSGRIEIGAGAAVGMGTVINAGAPVIIGRGSTIGGYSLINASEPAYQTRQPILEQPYEHSPIYFDEDVYGGFNVFVNRGSQIGRGAVLGARSSISGVVPPYAVMMGEPARVVRWRGSCASDSR